MGRQQTLPMLENFECTSLMEIIRILLGRLGESVVIAGDAVSSPQSDENGSNAGKVVVYQYSNVSKLGCSREDVP